MITLKEILMIVNLCTTQIDPTYSRDVCVNDMILCMQDELSFEICQGYWTDEYEKAAFADGSF